MRVLVVIAALVLISVPASAQNCQDGLPCQQVPWDLPQLPVLNSPTPLPTLYATAASSGSVPTPTATPTSPVSGFGFDARLATLQFIAESTLEVPYGDTISDQQITDLSRLTFSAVNWIRDFRFGVFTPLFAVFSFFLLSVFAFALFNFYVSVVPGLFGFIRKVVQVVLDFLPF